ncbi:DUF4136 domain-containing protein [Carboxylicivirga linearis]|uniref:DUF4136 domain-containing protein n=1 Tax=Carboxylicivirga linearis TaxID=1628157 RepID=A0ABS5JVK9_9BACT|nr:DUF4136 domain-containing protein [Carboxylicivirga linearis]MBS2098506.1 DUF4136 domain-containing protein [Carboxylicivirga linearis]
MKFNLLVALFIIALTSCDGIKVMSDYDKSVDFEKYETIQFYGWEENSDQILSKFDKERIENAVSLEFRNRGHQIVESNAELVVSLFIITKTETRETATTEYYGGYGPYFGYGPQWGWGPGYGYGYASTTIDKQDFQVGTLVISVYDRSKKELIWEGVGQGSVGENTSNREARLNHAIGKIMYKYPVKPLRK